MNLKSIYKFAKIKLSFLKIFNLVFVSLLLSGVALIFYATDSFSATGSVVVTAKILPNPTDFETALVTSTIVDPVEQNTVINYKITYGSLLSYPTTLVVTAKWNDGEVIDEGLRPVEIVDYLPESASNAFNNTTPVVDLVNHKITWTISNFPSNTTGQEIIFSLKTNSNYRGSSNVSFTSDAYLSVGQLDLPKETVSKLYSYNSTLDDSEESDDDSSSDDDESDSDTQSTTTTDLLTTVANPVQIEGFKFQKIQIREISSNFVSLFFDTNKSVKLKVEYGLSPKSLSDSIDSVEISGSHLIKISGLLENQVYYFKVTAYDADGNYFSSNIYQIKTALESEAPEILDDSIIITSGKSILSDPSSKKNSNSLENFVVIPKNQPIELKFGLNKSKSVKRVQVLIRKSDSVINIFPDINTDKVLGLRTPNLEQKPDANVIDPVELTDDYFVGVISSPKLAGNYNIVSKISDEYGNILERKIAVLKVIENFKILSSKNNAPIENAQVDFYYYDLRLKDYLRIEPQKFSILNPQYSDFNGEISIVLPKGTFRANIIALGYEEKQVEFEIGQFAGQEFPNISLEKKPFSLITAIKYYWTILSDVLLQTKLHIQNISQSIRFFELNALFTIVILSFLTVFSLASRFHIPLHSLYDFIVHHSRILLTQKKFGERIKGRVFDETTSEVLKDSDVFLIDSDKRKIVAHTKTNEQGDFSFMKINTSSYDLEVMKEGYEPLIFKESEIQEIGLGGYLLSIKKRSSGLDVKEKISIYFSKFFSLIFETLLLMLFIFEISLGYALGWNKILPFLLIAIINLFLWIVHLSHQRSERNVF